MVQLNKLELMLNRFYKGEKRTPLMTMYWLNCERNTSILVNVKWLKKAYADWKKG